MRGFANMVRQCAFRPVVVQAVAQSFLSRPKAFLRSLRPCAIIAVSMRLRVGMPKDTLPHSAAQPFWRHEMKCRHRFDRVREKIRRAQEKAIWFRYQRDKTKIALGLYYIHWLKVSSSLDHLFDPVWAKNTVSLTAVLPMLIMPVFVVSLLLRKCNRGLVVNKWLNWRITVTYYRNISNSY